MPVDFCRHLGGKNSEKCVSLVIALKYALLVGQSSYGHFLKLTDQFYLNDDDDDDDDDDFIGMTANRLD